MAVSWDVKIQVTDLKNREVSVTATRTDDSVTPPEVRSYRAEGKYDTESQTKQELLDMYSGIFYDLYQAELAKETQIATLVGQAETALQDALMAKETA